MEIRENQYTLYKPIELLEEYNLRQKVELELKELEVSRQQIDKLILPASELRAKCVESIDSGLQQKVEYIFNKLKRIDPKEHRYEVHQSDNVKLNKQLKDVFLRAGYGIEFTYIEVPRVFMNTTIYILFGICLGIIGFILYTFVHKITPPVSGLMLLTILAIILFFSLSAFFCFFAVIMGEDNPILSPKKVLNEKVYYITW